MTVFFQQIVTGLSIGSIYALLAVGYALVFSIYNFSNFAFGVIMMVGTFGAFYAINLAHVPLPLAIVIGMIVAALASELVEASTYRPMRNKHSPRLFLMIAGIGVNFFVENLAIQTLGSSVKPFPSNWGRQIIHFGHLSIACVDVLSGGVAILMLICLWWFIFKTKIGLSIRASSFDVNTTGLMGVNVDMVSFAVFALSGLTAGVAGVVYGMKYTVYPSMGAVSNKAFVAAVIGGLGSLPGAVMGGIILGLLETMVSAYISSRLRDMIAYLVLIIVLIFFPNGLIGKSVKNKL
ncbi:MAG: branched-chain amino acid ABC transporter permease [Bacillota bacterium]|nr:branched-chain amino acid ABC transporter permease [Bacillota bacterium]